MAEENDKAFEAQGEGAVSKKMNDFATIENGSTLYDTIIMDLQ